ncbi:MAG: hypothetical protein NVS9B8_17440 [Candidatus Limnocylindrales bacterium]
MDLTTKHPLPTVWFAAALLGALAGALTLEIPSIGWLLVFGFALPATLAGRRSAALGGMLLGLGAAWIALLSAASARCTTFNAEPGQGCTEPDLGPWLTIGFAMLVGGALLTSRAWWNRPRS